MAAHLMKALVYDKASMPWDHTRGFELREVPRPTLDEKDDPADADRAIVKVVYAGFCGSDRGIWNRVAFKGHIFESLKREHKTVRIIGHELVGEVVEIGTRAHATYGYKPKDVVSAESHIICGVCLQCRIGQTHVCAQDRIIGIGQDGCFAEYVKLPAQVLWPTDRRKIRLEVAALQEPFGNAVHACTVADIRGRTVAVFGCGTIGLFVIMIARALGATRIIGVEPLAKNRRMAEQLGADAVLALDPARVAHNGWSADRQLVGEVREAAGGNVDVAIEMAGHNTSVNNAIQATRRGGEVVLFGLKQGNFRIQDFDRVIVNGITLHSVIGRRIFATWEITRKLLEDKGNGIQDRIYNVLLGGGSEAIVPIETFAPGPFEEVLAAWPKPLLDF